MIVFNSVFILPAFKPLHPNNIDTNARNKHDTR